MIVVVKTTETGRRSGSVGGRLPEYETKRLPTYERNHELQRSRDSSRCEREKMLKHEMKSGCDMYVECRNSEADGKKLGMQEFEMTRFGVAWHWHGIDR